jgi:HEAT repeat protein
MLDVLRQSGKGESETAPLTLLELVQGFESAEASVRYAAAFLAGRCRTTAPGAARIDEILRGLLSDATTTADVAIEAAMSAALRGEVELGHARLLRAATNGDPFADAYKAAFFLAQFGDMSAWPAMVQALSSDIAHFRLMALRHLAGFLPFEGQTVGGTVIDVRARLLAGLADRDPLVRQEMPFLLEEAATPELRRILLPVASSDADPSVRSAAEIVLSRLP